MLKKLALSVVSAAMVAGLSVSGASAKSGVKVGQLTCTVEGGFGLIIASKKDMTCTFNAANGAVELYTGSISKFGIDIGVTKEATMVWVVFAPGKVNPGALRGKYVGATAEATAGVGAGANVLVGGFNKSITLQPLSVQGQTGLNVAAGVGVLNLR